MKIKPFGVERWMDLYETSCKYNLAETCVDSISLEQLDKLIDDGINTVDLIKSRRLTYGDIPGLPAFREGIAALYNDVSIDRILTTNGAIGANFLSLFTLVEPGDEVVSIIPTYQQHYSIPESLGAQVKIMQLKPDNNFLPDIEELRSMVSEKTKMICLNNPNNPTGALLPEEELMKIIKIASSVDAYVLCDEVYRHLNHKPGYAPSIVDLYEKGISTSSMSKVFSLAGLRLGWVVAPLEVIERIYDMRHYNIISCGMIDEMIGARALVNKDKILERNTAIVQTNSAILDRWIQSEVHIHYVTPEAGTTALLYYDMDISSTDLCHDMMQKTGLMMVPGDCFDMGKCLRVGYAFNSRELEEGLEIFKTYLRQYD
jgi:aspartate/methionine/tyrosine aminotransferase